MHSGNKRIVKNTGFMYVKFFSNMVIGLYTSRLVLQTLGVVDYGIFCVVGGVLAMFTFISSSLSSATTRFMNAEMGKPDGDVNKTFNINLVLHSVFAFIIFVLAQTIGLWYIYNGLNVEPDKVGQAAFVYEITVVTTCLGIINTPYQGLLNAYERFQFMALFDVGNNIFRLLCILLLSFYSGPYALPIYGLIYGLTTINTFVAYHWLSYRRWRGSIRHHIVWGWHNYKDVLVFNNWNLLSTMAQMARSSGSDLVVNNFFGTAMNGALGISNTVRSHLMSFSSNFEAASAPQIVQAYTSGDMARCNYIVNKMGRLSLLLFEVFCFPLLIELRYVLELWLGEVPQYTFIFTQLNILIAGVAISCGGLTNYINATGQIKWFTIQKCFFFLACIPAGYYLYSIGWAPKTMLYCFLLADVLLRIGQLILMRIILNFDSWQYVREAYARPALIAVLMSSFMYAHSLLTIETGGERLLSIIVCGILNSVVIFCIGLTPGERAKLLGQLKRV